MKDQVDNLQAIVREQRELIKRLMSENRRLGEAAEILSERIQDLEQRNIVIDQEIAEVSIDFDLIPDRYLNS